MYFSASAAIISTFLLMSSFSKASSGGSSSSPSSSNPPISTGWWSRLVTAATATAEVARDVYSIAHDAYGIAYNVKASQVLGAIDRSDELSADQLPLKRSMLRAAELSAQVYKIIGIENDGHVLSFGVDQQPDCLVHTEGDTIWVSIRGSHTGEDVIHDATWCLQTGALGDLEVPLGVIQRCQSIYSAFRLYLEQLSQKKKIKKINFCGHSLGGAIASGMYIAWFKDQSTALCCSELLSKDLQVAAFTFGSPLLLSNPPPQFTFNPFTNKDAHSSHPLTSNVHNVVLQLDVVPRLLGGHALPTYLTQSMVGATVHSLMTSGVHRETYRPFGRYYSLREPTHSGTEHPFLRGQEPHVAITKQPSLGKVADPTAFLRKFPTTTADFAFGLTRDHSMDRTLSAMKASISL